MVVLVVVVVVVVVLSPCGVSETLLLVGGAVFDSSSG